ncbi:MAG: ribosome silencing factor [Actinobacteria bacterium]|nr:ribosome silencing factor [Actinomycetota bacterium]
MRATSTTAGLPGGGGELGVSAIECSVTAARAAASKKGERTVVLEMTQLLGVVDTFVITSATNVRQVRTIAEEVELQVKQAHGLLPRFVEGRGDLRWLLMDYGMVVAHIFLEEARDYYDLERLWSDAPRLDWDAAQISLREIR